MDKQPLNKTIQNYDKYANEYHEHISSAVDGIYHVLYEKPALASLLPNLNRLNVMSFGCGSGADLYLAKEQKPAQIIGVDPSAGLLEIAQNDHPDVRFINADAENIDLPENSLDVIYSSLVMHYIEDWVSTIRKLNSLLKPGGILIFSCAHPIESSTAYGQTDDDNKYALLGRKTHEPTDNQQIFGNYMGAGEDGIVQKQGKLGSIEIDAYHRSFSRMFNDIQAGGMQIKKIIEPVPLPKMKDIDKNTYDRLNHLPVFILFQLIKA